MEGVLIFLLGWLLGEVLLAIKTSWLLYHKINFFGVNGKLIKEIHKKQTNPIYTQKQGDTQ